MASGSDNSGAKRTFADKLLDAVAANAAAQLDLTGREWPLEDLTPLREVLQTLAEDIKRLSPALLSQVICDLSLVIWQLRAWYSPGVGFIVLALLERVGGGPQRLPAPPNGADPGLAVLRLLEGLVLVSVVRLPSQKKAAVKVLEKILHKRRIPPCTSVRLESALVCLTGTSWAGVPSASPLSDA
ncbi:unnamed protein product, partial [Polarella glacialis]